MESKDAHKKSSFGLSSRIYYGEMLRRPDLKFNRSDRSMLVIHEGLPGLKFWSKISEK